MGMVVPCHVVEETPENMVQYMYMGISGGTMVGKGGGGMSKLLTGGT